MTLEQYLIAWILYLLAAVGCLAVWWKITSFITHASTRQWLRLLSAVIVLTPGVTQSDTSYLSPAFLAVTFDGLSAGPGAMLNNGLILLGTLAVTTLVKLLFFRGSKSPDKKPASRDAGKSSDNKTQPASGKRVEPSVS